MKKIEVEDADTARLISRIQGGEDDLFGEIYLRYFDRCYAFLRTMLGSHEAEDATHEAFLNALRAVPRYDPTRAPFRSWLFAIMKNSAIRDLEKLRRALPVEPGEAQSYSDGPTEPRLDLVDWLSDRALAAQYHGLPEPQRRVLALRYVLDLSHDQIAAAINRRPDDVRMLHSRAIRRLRSTMLK